MADWVVIANPVSGGGRGRKVAETVVRKLRERGVDADLRLTEARGHAVRIASEALSEGCGRIAACGGDGTIGEVAGALANTNAVLGLIPCGRGNDFARALGVRKKTDLVVETLASGVGRRVDLGRVGGRFFCGIACIGFDAEAGRLVYDHQVPFTGTPAYLLAVLKTLRRYECPDVRIEGEAGVFEGPILLAAFGNTGFYGGGMRIVPRAVCDDGLLDACVVDPVSRLKLLRFFPRIFSGAHVRLPEVHTLRNPSVRVTSSRPLHILADGEPAGQTPVTIEIVPRVLTVICPVKLN